MNTRITRHLPIAIARVTSLLALLLVLLVAGGCRSAHSGEDGGAPPAAQRTQVEKPWTKEVVESHEYLWLELSTGKRGVMTGPVFGHDDHGDFLTTKSDAKVHIALSDVAVMEAIDISESGPPHPPVQSLGGSLLAFWAGLPFFLPTIILILILT